MEKSVQFRLCIHHDGIGKPGTIVVCAKPCHIQIIGMTATSCQKKRLDLSHIRAVGGIGIVRIEYIIVVFILGIR